MAVDGTVHVVDLDDNTATYVLAVGVAGITDVRVTMQDMFDGEQGADVP